jgi:D-alanyl-D-alanine carboxypeptidase (penicillin-binding protein 5/6)
MQEEAQRLGADRTRVAGPSGLDEEGQVSTAHDLAAIGRAALEVPGIVAHATTVRADFPGAMPAPGERRETFEIGTQQDFVREYDGALGLKNGFTSEARNTLVAAAERDGRTLVVTLMRSTGDTDAEAAALMDWGFAHAGRVEPVGALPDAEPRPASGAAAGTGAGTEAPLALAATATASEPAPSLLERAVGALVRLLLVLLLAVAALRARVLLRRRRRRAAARHRRAARAAGSRPPAPRAAQDAEVPSEYADRGRQTASAPWT